MIAHRHTPCVPLVLPMHWCRYHDRPAPRDGSWHRYRSGVRRPSRSGSRGVQTEFSRLSVVLVEQSFAAVLFAVGEVPRVAPGAAVEIVAAAPVQERVREQHHSDGRMLAPAAERVVLPRAPGGIASPRHLAGSACGSPDGVPEEGSISTGPPTMPSWAVLASTLDAQSQVGAVAWWYAVVWNQPAGRPIGAVLVPDSGGYRPPVRELATACWASKTSVVRQRSRRSSCSMPLASASRVC